MKYRSEDDRIAIEKMAADESLSVDEFVKKRDRILGRLRGHLVDFRKSQDMKANWTRNRRKYQSAINDFHSSTQGKRFHRQLGRFLALRAPLYKEESFQDDMVAISSLQTHLLIESAYLRASLDEQFAFEEMVREAMPALNEALTSLLEKRDLSPEIVEVLQDLTDPTQIKE